MSLRKWFENLLHRIKALKRESLSRAAPFPSKTASPTRSTAPAVPKVQSDVLRRKLTKVVVVGIDFGTSGTKIVIGDTTTQRHYLLSNPERPQRDPSFVFPSIVHIRDNRAFFCAGAANGNKRADAEFNSFKVCLACQHGLASCRGCAHRGETPGLFLFPNLMGVDQLEAEQIATFYLAFVIGYSKREIERRWGDEFVLKPLFNIGAPIDQWNAQRGSEVFTRVAFYGEKLSAAVLDGAPLVDLLTAYKRMKAEYPRIPPEAERVVFVQPETAAGLMSFVTSPRAATGLYGIVDVGAGTTDVSFFRLADFNPDEPRRMSFYDAKTDVVGAGDFDRSLARLAVSRLPSLNRNVVEENSPEMLSAARSAKETLGITAGCEIRFATGTVKLSRAEVEASFTPIITQMVRTYVETNHRAYEKEKLVNRWETFTVMTLGGGTKCLPVYNALRTTYPSTYNKKITFARIPIPTDIDCDSSARDNFELVAVAYGLSFPTPDFPEILSPSAVSPIDFTLPAKNGPDRDELYPK